MDIREVKKGKTERDFISFPFHLYRNDPLFVPPLWQEMRKILQDRANALFSNGPHAFYLAYEGQKVLGRIAVGINQKFNQVRGKREGYITLFECIRCHQVARALFERIEKWLWERGMEAVIGPVSPTNGDDFRGMLVENFADPPFIFTPYNPPYYEELWQAYGFRRYHTFVAFHYDLQRMPFEEVHSVIEYAKKKYHFTVRPMSYKNLKEEISAIQMILESSLNPLEYDYVIPPSLEEILQMAYQFKRFIPPGFAQIAWADDNPIGFAVALPDYNLVLKDIKGKILTTVWLKFLREKKKINRGRAFLLFVVPSYQGKGVPTALLFEIFKEGRKRGYLSAEGSSINIENTKMCREAEGLGGIPYKKFALFCKVIRQS
ncbi:MAG: GNAT family N-acetyltransferase [Candidatus Caldatribacteriaceae bacterium]